MSQVAVCTHACIFDLLLYYTSVFPVAANGAHGKGHQ